MKYVIKVNATYVASMGLWTKFTPFKENAKIFYDKDSTDKAVEELLDDSYYRTFSREDVSVVPY